MQSIWKFIFPIVSNTSLSASYSKFISIGILGIQGSIWDPVPTQMMLPLASPVSLLIIRAKFYIK